jgi:hypothetical protein
MKIKAIKAWVAIDKETGQMFGGTHREGFKELYLHPTKRDADKAGYGKEYWQIVPVLITFNLLTK